MERKARGNETSNEIKFSTDEKALLMIAGRLSLPMAIAAVVG